LLLCGESRSLIEAMDTRDVWFSTKLVALRRKPQPH